MTVTRDEPENDFKADFSHMQQPSKQSSAVTSNQPLQASGNDFDDIELGIERPEPDAEKFEEFEFDDSVPEKIFLEKKNICLLENHENCLIVCVFLRQNKSVRCLHFRLFI